jgi:hypothetical protein
MLKPLEFERVSVEEAAKSIEDNIRPGTAKDWQQERRQAPAETINDATAEWLASLSSDVRPLELARQFPRIANMLSALWRRPAQCDEYLKKLMMNDRGTRKGFPRAVGKELSVLATHYAVLHPYRRSVWDEVAKL